MQYSVMSEVFKALPTYFLQELSGEEFPLTCQRNYLLWSDLDIIIILGTPGWQVSNGLSSGKNR
jgi:hypothetical protein